MTTGAAAGLGPRGASSEPTASTCTVQADRSSGDGDMVVIGIVPTLIGESGVTGPELGRSPVHRVAASIQAEVGSGQPHDLVVTLGDLEAGGSRSTRDVVQRRPVCRGSTGRYSEAEGLVAGWMKFESGSSLDKRGSRGEGGKDCDEGELRQHDGQMLCFDTTSARWF